MINAHQARSLADEYGEGSFDRLLTGVMNNIETAARKGYYTAWARESNSDALGRLVEALESGGFTVESVNSLRGNIQISWRTCK